MKILAELAEIFDITVACLICCSMEKLWELLYEMLSLQ